MQNFENKNRANSSSFQENSYLKKDKKDEIELIIKCLKNA
jgi:hypothetical protein